MARRAVLCLLFFVAGFIPRGQVNNNAPSYLAIYKEAEELYNNADANELTDSLALVKYRLVIAKLVKQPYNDSILFNSYIRCGVLLTTQKKDLESLQNFFGAISLNQRSTSLADSLSFFPWLFAGNNYYDLFNPDSALICYKKAEQLFLQHPGLKEAERMYNKTGVLYYEAGDYAKSIPYFTKALSLVNAGGENSRYFVVNYQNNIASAYRKLHEYNKALAIYKTLQQYGIYNNEVLHNIGVTYLDAGNCRQALNYLKQLPVKDASAYNDMARAFLGLVLYDSAEICLKAALRVANGPAAAEHANTLKLLGDLLMARQQPAAALLKYHFAVMESVPGFKDSLPSTNPSSFGALYHFFFLFNALAAKAQAFQALYANKSNVQFLKNAFSAYGSALFLARHMERSYGTDESKLFLKQNVEAVNKTAVEAGLQLFKVTGDSTYLQQVFTFIENSKASILQAGLYDVELSSLKGMPLGLLQKEKKLKALLAALDLQSGQTADSSKLAFLEQQKQNAAIQLSQVQEQLNENTAYARLKFSSKDQGINEIRNKLLKSDEAIVSYYITGKMLICFYLGKQQYGYVSSPLQPGLGDEIMRFNNQLNSPDGGDTKTIDQLSRSLYVQLIQPIEIKIKTATHLIIIPHNELSYIPFEILNSPATGHLLLEEHAVSYQYSVNFLNATSPENKSYQVLAMAPFTKPQLPTALLPQLPGSKAEVEGLPGKHLLDSMATKSAFIDFSNSYPVVHLATHAQANDSFPAQSYISFYGDAVATNTSARLYEQEIYHLNMANTRLAILSACETGSGRLVNSEGVISLSRAFSYAGCKSVITSLWKADDAATAFITKKLHMYLQQGDAIDIALQKAKLDYLKTDEVETRFKKPSYWANLILIGDARQITATKANWFLIACTMFLFVFAALYLIKTVYRKKRYTAAE